jgi:hypothetical protein
VRIGDGFQVYVMSPVGSPFIVLLEPDDSDTGEDGVFIPKDPNNTGSTLDLAVEAFDRGRPV